MKSPPKVIHQYQSDDNEDVEFMANLMRKAYEVTDGRIESVCKYIMSKTFISRTTTIDIAAQSCIKWMYKVDD